MTFDTAALAGILRDGTDQEQAAAYQSLVAIMGTADADQLWSDAARQADGETDPWPCDFCSCSGCPGCVRPHAADDCGCWEWNQ